MTTQSSILFLVTLAALCAASPARADDTATCGEAFDQSQVKRDEGKLLEARRLLRICSGASCSPTLQRLCLDWQTDVTARLPSFVLTAKDGSGGDLVDVKVTMDGVLVATNLDGRGIDVDPGLHSFVFELPDGTRAETKAVADERGKGKLVSVVLRSLPAPVPARPETAVVPASVALPPPRSQDTTSGGGGPLKTVGLVVGAAGVVGLVLGGVFGVEALSTKGSHCSSNGLCDPGSASSVYSQATISTVGFIAGGVLVAGGAALYFLAPKSTEGAATLSVAPMVGSTTGGVQLAGSW